MLGQAPSLVHPQILDADATKVEIGTFLPQIQDGQEKIISIESKCKLKQNAITVSPDENYWLQLIFYRDSSFFFLGRKFFVWMDSSTAGYWMRIYSDSYGPKDRQLCGWSNLLPLTFR